MRKVFKRISLLIAALFVALTVAQPLTALADVPYKTFSQNGYGEYIQSQTAYKPAETIYKITNQETEEVYYLDQPSDMVLAPDGLLYIADTGNNRVIICDKEGNFVNSIGEDVLYKPTGIYVSEEGLIYVTMPLQSKFVSYGIVYVFNKDGEIVTTYDKPNSLLFGSDVFKPSKIIVDKGGNMYIVSQGNSNGIIQLSPTDGGTFLGYFGTGEVFFSPIDVFLKLILSEEQQATRTRRVPQTTKNLSIDSKGIIYTLIDGTSGQPLKKLNKAGTNMLTLEVMPFNGNAVAIGQYENIYVATSTGYIYEYTKEGTLLFRFGGQDETMDYRTGLFSPGAIQAIRVDENDKLFVLDSKANSISTFMPTEFTQYVHESLGYYQKGDYTNTKIYLERIIDMNSMFDYANQAMGLTLFNEEKYSESMSYFRLAKDKQGYSDSFWEIRNVWLTNNLVYALLVIAAIFLVLKGIKILDEKHGIFNPIRKSTEKFRNTYLYRQFFFGKRFMRHPVDASYEVKHYKMSSNLASSLLILLYIVIYIINKYFGGFIVKTARDGRYNIFGDILVFVIGFLAAATVTYLMCTINDGEGRFKEILSGYVYSFTPYVFIQPLLFVLGMVVTFNEIFLIEFSNIIMITWIAILIFIAIKEINNYTIKETFKIIFLTLFAAFVFALIIFVIYVLGQQLISFVRSVYGEVVYRIGK